ncbi:hypothetical protein [Streptomyces sp. H39-C1]|uniref:hypothetical protein n=1 Tax=Streptomyces sp. H39-C1 TaxID=3004355 RepID=UPI0022AF358C|nr:hypothetical protein [Streptomyces sp. H39-C1]
MDAAGHEPSALFNFQTRLFHASYRAQQAAGDITRALKRLGQGKSPGWPVSRDADTHNFAAPPWVLACRPNDPDRGAWERERIVADRVVRQLRCVGDGLAWRVCRYRREYMIALSRHDPAGPFVGKDGLGYEIGRVIDYYQKNGKFALLNDLTSVLRHCDVTEVRNSRYQELCEVKARPTRTARAKAAKQRREAQHALLVADGIEPIPGIDGGALIVRSHVQLRTHVRELTAVFDRAERDGHAVARVGDRVVRVFHGGVTDPIAALQQSEERHQAALARYLPQPMQPLRVLMNDAAASDPLLAPYSIYPLPAGQRAALICDHLLVEVTLSAQALQHSFRQTGLAAQILLTAADPDSEAVMKVIGTKRTATLYSPAVRQLLLEFIHTRCFVRAFAAELARPGRSRHNLLTFSNEQAAWR